jgi:hypothetical protein
MTIRMTRREFTLATGAAAAASLAPPAFAQTVLMRAIPSSGERLPAVGLGTAQVFNANDEATQQKARCYRRWWPAAAVWSIPPRFTPMSRR